MGGSAVVFDITVKREHAANVIRIVGELAQETIQQFIDVIENITSENKDPIIIDMSHIDFLDSKGAGYLLQMKQKLNGREVALAEVPESIHRVLMRLMVIDQFRTFKTLEDALKRI